MSGLQTEIPQIADCVALITDTYTADITDSEMVRLEKMATHLYGLVHARYILTTRGLQKMLEKYRNCDFGRCPREMCQQHPLLPVGTSDIPRQSTVKLYCAKCEDVYVPKRSTTRDADSAYFGRSFPAMLFQAYPNIIPEKRPKEIYVPTIFGFKLHNHAKLARWRESKRLEMEDRIKEAVDNDEMDT